VFVEANQESGGQFLQTGTVPAQGATVRIVTNDWMIPGQLIELIWYGLVPYSASVSVVEQGHYVDFIVPKAVIESNAVEGDIGYCNVFYQLPLVNGSVERSPVIRIAIVDVAKANPAPVIPQALNGELIPDSILKPGLKIEYPRTVHRSAVWTSYGRDGRVIAMVTFKLAERETFVYMWRLMLNQAEAGGEVRTNYMARNDEDIFCQSLHAVLRVVSVADVAAAPHRRVRGWSKLIDYARVW
jgi:hypothetical protein